MTKKSDEKAVEANKNVDANKDEEVQDTTPEQAAQGEAVTVDDEAPKDENVDEVNQEKPAEFEELKKYDPKQTEEVRPEHSDSYPAVNLKADEAREERVRAEPVDDTGNQILMRPHTDGQPVSDAEKHETKIDTDYSKE